MSAAPSAPPPEYTAEGSHTPPAETDGFVNQPPQVLIAPLPNATDFQRGRLGVEGEHASVEGEVQIKGAVEGAWDTVSISFQTTERSIAQSVELGSTAQVLYRRIPASQSTSRNSIRALPSSLPFSIPLTSDTPECLHTPTSSLSHSLKVQLTPSDPSAEVFGKEIPLHLCRYSTPNAPFLPTLPCTVQLDAPTPIIIQLPRLEFRVGEPIPVYITIPPPDRQRVSQSGIRLRNVKAELIRFIKLNEPSTPKEEESSPISPSESDLGEGTSTARRLSSFPDEKKSANARMNGDSRLGSLSSSSDGSTHSVVLSRSGAACRFHSSRPVRVRLVLHPFSLSSEISSSGVACSSAAAEEERQNEGCASITQTTLLHTVSFLLVLRIGFFSAADKSDLTVEETMRITLVPRLAPEEEDTTASQYSKKHDPPPERTVRVEDGPTAPPFSTFEAAGAPGPATPDISAPPPFFSEPSGSQAFYVEPSSSQPPSFLEAASEVGSSSSTRLAEWSQSDPLRQVVLRIHGEGHEFGFVYEDIYDGIADGSRTPPPSLPASEQDEDVTGLVELVNQTLRATEALELQSESTRVGVPPPPPPAMDDPLDPPPAIDDAFRPVAARPDGESAAAIPSPLHIAERSTSTIQSPSPLPEQEPSPPIITGGTEGGPPPYLNPSGPSQHTDAPGPPPYSDFPGVPSAV